MSGRVSTIVKIIRFAERHGALSIKDLPGCWHRKVDERWEMWLNGHREPVAVDGHGDVPPFSAYVEFNGWPAGVINVDHAVFAAGSCANLDEFERALDPPDATEED